MSNEVRDIDLPEQTHTTGTEHAQASRTEAEESPQRGADPQCRTTRTSAVLASAETKSVVDDVSQGAEREAPKVAGQSKTDETGAQKERPVNPVPPSVVRHTVRRLPNCKITGIDYQASFADTVSRFAPHEIISTGIDQEDPKVGFALQWNPEKHEFTCHPEQAGEFEIDLCVDVVRHEQHIFPFRLTVNPDPKTLWKNIPSASNAVYAKPDCDKVFLACGEKLSIVAASQRGRSHAQDGKPRDDDFIADYNTEADCAILLVADGAGSAKYSREGSRLATRTALENLKAAMEGDFWASMKPAIAKWAIDKDVQAKKSIEASLYKVLIHAAWEAKTRIKKEAQDFEVRHLADYKKTEKFTARDYATTLIMTVVKKLDSGGWFVATFWVGDGGMGILRASAGEVRVQGTPDGGEYGGQTRFLTEDSAEVWPQDAGSLIARRLRFDVVDSFDAIILMTDGVTDPMFETESNLTSIEKWNGLWADLAKAVPFGRRDASVADVLLEWLDFWSSGNHDDRTIMILY